MFYALSAEKKINISKWSNIKVNHLNKSCITVGRAVRQPLSNHLHIKENNNV